MQAWKVHAKTQRWQWHRLQSVISKLAGFDNDQAFNKQHRLKSMPLPPLRLCVKFSSPNCEFQIERQHHGVN